MDRNSGVWGGVGPIGNATLAGDPAARTDMAGNLNAVVTATDHTLQQTWMNRSTGTWAGTQTISTNVA
jgi:hypothetical protein